MVRLIAATQEALALGGAKGPDVPATPKWVTPMLLFIDLYEKVQIYLLSITQDKWVVVFFHYENTDRLIRCSLTFLGKLKFLRFFLQFFHRFFVASIDLIMIGTGTSLITDTIFPVLFSNKQKNSIFQSQPVFCI
jgi:hypothetical protein